MFDHVFDIEVPRSTPRHQRAVGRDDIQRAESARIAREHAEKEAASHSVPPQPARGLNKNAKD